MLQHVPSPSVGTHPTRSIGVIASLFAAAMCHAGVTTFEGPEGRGQWANAFGASQQTITFNESVLQYASYITTQYVPGWGVNFANGFTNNEPAHRGPSYEDSYPDRTILTSGTTSSGQPWEGVFMRFTQPQRAVSYNRIGWRGMALNIATIHVTLHGYNAAGGMGPLIGEWHSDWPTLQDPLWNTFVGLISNESFYGARIWYTQILPGEPTLFAIDDVSFSTVPTPGALSVLALAGAGTRRKRRRS